MANFEQFSYDFYKYLYKNNYIEDCNLEILKNLKIAISASYIINKINKLSRINPLNGISSYEIAQYLYELKEKFAKYGIRIMIVLSGIVRHDLNNQQYFQENMMIFRKTWETIYNKYYSYSSYPDKRDYHKNIGSPNSSYTDTNNSFVDKKYELEELLDKITYKVLEEKHLIPVLNHYEIEYLHAPYYTINQLKYFTEYNFAHLAVCGIESIIFGMNCILDFDIENEKFKWLDVKKLNKNNNIDQAKATQLFLVGGLDPSNDIHIPVPENLFCTNPNEENIRNRVKSLQNDRQGSSEEIFGGNGKNQISSEEYQPQKNLNISIGSGQAISTVGQSNNEKVLSSIKITETKSTFELAWKELQGNMLKLLSENEKKLIHDKRKRLEVSIVINSDCEIDITPRENLELLTRFYGPYFPSYIYMLYIYNIVDKDLIENIANEKFLIKAPIADSAELHHHIDNYFKGTLEKMLGILLSKLHPNIKKANYSLTRFYFPDKNYNLVAKEYKPAKFLLKHEFIEKEKAKIQWKKNIVSFIQTAIIYTEYLKEINENNKKNTSVLSNSTSTTARRKESVDFIFNPKLGSNKNPKSFEMIDENIPQNVSPSHTSNSLESTNSPTYPNNVNQAQVEPQTHMEMYFNVYLSFLELYDYLDTQNQRLMVIGAALRKCPETYEDAMIMLIELMKPGFTLLNGREFNNSKRRKVSSEMPLNTADKREHLDNEFYQINLWNFNQIPEEKKRYIVLISRVFSLINPKIKAPKSTASKTNMTHSFTQSLSKQEFSNPTSQEINNHESCYFDPNENNHFDYDLCQYLVILQNLQTMLRYSFDSLMIYNFLAYYPKKDLKNLFELRKQLPFRDNLSIFLGIAVKKLMQTNDNLDEFKAKNPEYNHYIEEDLMHGYQLWESVYTFIKYQENRGDHNAELSELFKGSHDFLVKRFKDLGLI